MKTVMEIAFYLAWIALFVKVVLVQVKVRKEKKEAKNRGNEE